MIMLANIVQPTKSFVTDPDKAIRPRSELSKLRSERMGTMTTKEFMERETDIENMNAGALSISGSSDFIFIRQLGKMIARAPIKPDMPKIGALLPA